MFRLIGSSSRATTTMEFGTKFIVLAFFVFVSGKAWKSVQAKSGVEVRFSESYEDAHLTVGQLIKKYGYNGETHHVTTDDGYILEVHRITSPNNNVTSEGKTPILLAHAFLSSSTDWIITGPGRGFGYLLADAGYDVWMVNFRGNNYSRKHVKYSKLDKEFWQFSWHENGVSDLPATIDFILRATSKKQLIYVGYSMGSAAFWAMSTELPEYQSKIKAMFALAPVAYNTHVKSVFYRVLAKFENNVEKIMNLLGRYEFEPSGKLIKSVAALFCHDEAWTQPVCTNIIFLIAGFGSDQLNTTTLPVILAHVPAGGSSKQFLHFLQVLKDRKFQQYDHGLFGNLKKYKRSRPPLYDLSRIMVPVHLHYASNDKLSDSKDVDRLYRELGNPITKIRVPHDTFGHLDFAWAKDGKGLLYDKLISLMEKYQD